MCREVTAQQGEPGTDVADLAGRRCSEELNLGRNWASGAGVGGGHRLPGLQEKALGVW